MIDCKLTTDIDVPVVGGGQAGLAAEMTTPHAGLTFMWASPLTVETSPMRRGEGTGQTEVR
jgi:hypothetical protein